MVIGSQKTPLGNQAFSLIQKLLRNTCSECKIIDCSNSSAELGKLMSNAMLAQRISSINSVSGLCEREQNCSLGQVKEIVSTDQRIGPNYLSPGPGFGGSCFEKDIKSLVFILDQAGERVPAQYWQSVLDMNEYQKCRIASLIAEKVSNKRRFQGCAVQAGICIMGFSYKKNTGDTRQCQAARIIDYLSRKEGFKISVTDP